MSDIGVLPSHEEGFPNSILEMMVLNLPVIATNVGGIPELVVDRETGLLVPPKQPAVLAEALLALSSDPALRSRMGKEGRFRVEEKFTLAWCLLGYRQAYSEMIHDGEKGVTAE